MSIDKVLAPLGGVKQTGDGRHIALCPAHDDKRPSLAIRELPDGRILLHCFAGCPTHDVLMAMGLAYWDLYPQAADFHLPKARRPFSAIDALKATAFEALLVATAASNLRQGIELTEADRERIWTAATRLQSAYEVATDA